MLIFLSANISAQTKVAVYQGMYVEHDLAVANAFIAGYNSYGIWDDTLDMVSTSINSAYTSGYDLYIKSYTGATSHFSEADQTWNSGNGMLVVMPLGSNTYAHMLQSDSLMSTLVLVGAGNDSNQTAYSIEFFGPDAYGNTWPASSFSAGYIAGQLAFIRDSLGCSWWEARYRARATASSVPWSYKNGFGKINVLAAINYSGAIKDDPYPRSIPVVIEHLKTRAVLRNLPVWFKGDSPE